ncbi:MAG: hypothetical protein PHX05_03460, partial [Acidobacteriota bacterium]|nr:hypothetical protein [Acidobacteriota bacterium]
ETFAEQEGERRAVKGQGQEMLDKEGDGEKAADVKGIPDNPAENKEDEDRQGDALQELGENPQAAAMGDNDLGAAAEEQQQRKEKMKKVIPPVAFCFFKQFDRVHPRAGKKEGGGKGAEREKSRRNEMRGKHQQAGDALGDVDFQDAAFCRPFIHWGPSFIGNG